MVTDRNDLGWVRPRLVDWLRLLASDHPTQMRFWDKVGHPDEMALIFNDLFRLCPQLVELHVMTRSEITSLSRIDEEFHKMGGPVHAELWTLDAIRQHESWSTIRRLAREALYAFGSEPADPVLDWVRVV